MLLYIRVILKISDLVTGKLNITSYCTMNIYLKIDFKLIVTMFDQIHSSL